MKENSNNLIIVANTHLYGGPSFNVIRLIQTIVSVKYIESVKNRLIDEDSTRNIYTFFGGDLNCSPNSPSVNYIGSKQVPIHESVIGKFFKSQIIKMFRILKLKICFKKMNANIFLVVRKC